MEGGVRYFCSRSSGETGEEYPIDDGSMRCFPGPCGGSEVNDCIPGLPCIKNIIQEGKEKWRETEKCLKEARDRAQKALNELREKFPFDGSWASEVATATGAATYLARGGGPKVMATTGIVTADSTAYPRLSQRVQGWYQIVWAWQKEIREKCGVDSLEEQRLPKNLRFPY